MTRWPTFLYVGFSFGQQTREAKKQVVDSESKSKKRRLVKSPDTFRERAEKAGQAADKPKRRGRVLSLLFKPLRPLKAPLVKVYRWKPINLLSKVIFPPYLRNSFKELKLVNWPNWQQGRRLTFAVIVFAAVFGAVVALVDAGLSRIFKHILLK
ncbi:MAG: preprotein translocase subunit SecE [Candidatus Saccharimonadales bacterium]